MLHYKHSTKEILHVCDIRTLALQRTPIQRLPRNYFEHIIINDKVSHYDMYAKVKIMKLLTQPQGNLIKIEFLKITKWHCVKLFQKNAF